MFNPLLKITLDGQILKAWVFVVNVTRRLLASRKALGLRGEGRGKGKVVALRKALGLPHCYFKFCSNKFSELEDLVGSLALAEGENDLNVGMPFTQCFASYA